MSTEPIIDPNQLPGPSQDEIAERARSAREQNITQSQRPTSIWGDDPDLEEFASKKGWQSPDQALRAYREQNTEASRMAQELAEARAEISALTDFMQSAQGAQEFSQQQQVPVQQVNQFQDFVAQFQYEDPTTGEVQINMPALMQQMAMLQTAATQQQLDAQRQEILGQLQGFVQPVQERYEQAEAEEVISELEDTYGERAEDVADMAQQLSESDAEFWDGMAERVGMRRTIEMLWAQANQQLELTTAAQRREQADSFTMTTSGRSASGRRKSPAEMEKEQIFRLAGQKGDDMFGSSLY